MDDALEPCGLAVCVLARVWAAVVRPSLTRLRFVGQSVDRVARTPDLIWVCSIAAPDLNLSSCEQRPMPCQSLLTGVPSA